MSDEGEPTEGVEVRVSGSFLRDLRRLVFQTGCESINQLVRQILWQYLYGMGIRAGDAHPSGTEERPQRKAIPAALRLAVLSRDGHRCISCGAAPTDSVLHMDHKIPVSRGGETTLENLQTLCESCNLAKGAKIIDFQNSARSGDSPEDAGITRSGAARGGRR